MSEKQYTARGFRVYGTIASRDEARWRVQESSLAGEGAHVRIVCEGESCKDFTPNTGGWRDHVPAPGDMHSHPDPHLSVEQAEQLIVALQAFVDEASDRSGGRGRR